MTIQKDTISTGEAAILTAIAELRAEARDDRRRLTVLEKKLDEAHTRISRRREECHQIGKDVQANKIKMGVIGTTLIAIGSSVAPLINYLTKGSI